LEGFRLDEYKQMDDGGEGMARLIRYFQVSLARKGGKCLRLAENHFQVYKDGISEFRITTDRDAAKEDEETSLLGREHPFVKQLLDEDRRLEGSARALAASRGQNSRKGVLSVWHVSLQDATQRFVQRVIPIGIDDQGNRNKTIELLVDSLLSLLPASESLFTTAARSELVSKVLPDMLRRDLAHKGLLSESVTLAWRLLAWIELTESAGSTRR
jgi:hypothetical protein